MTPDKEPLMDDDRLVLAEVKTLVGTIREDIHEMREDFRRSNENKVTRPEWLQRNDTVDQRIYDQEKAVALLREAIAKEMAEVKADHARDMANLKSDLQDDITEIKEEIASKRIQVPAMIAIVVSILTFAWVVIGPVITAQSQAPASPVHEDQQTNNFSPPTSE